MSKIDAITSDRVRRAITGSATPARDILDFDSLTSDERQQASDYFASCGGLEAAAGIETNFMRANDC